MRISVTGGREFADEDRTPIEHDALAHEMPPISLAPNDDLRSPNLHREILPVVGYSYPEKQFLQFRVEGLQVGGDGRQRLLRCVIQDAFPEVVTSIDVLAPHPRTQVRLRLSSAGPRGGFVLNISPEQILPIFPNPSWVSSVFGGIALSFGICLTAVKAPDEKPVAVAAAFRHNSQTPTCPPLGTGSGAGVVGRNTPT